MNILLTGGTGFIGKALTKALLAQEHQLTILSRNPQPKAVQGVRFIQNFAHLQNLDEFDAVINLAGEPIFDKRWTAAQKQRLTESRLSITQQLVELFQKSSKPPRCLLSVSATGFYGDLAKVSDEQTACGTSFSATLCQAWEQTARQAEPYTRVCLLRTGIVLSPDGGALAKMLPLYKLGLAGKLGNGQQHWAWISLEDEVRAILFLLHHSTAQGAFNLVAPQLTTNADFNRLLAEKLHRPAFLHTPKALLRLVLGERAELLLDNQPLVPNKLLSLGFEFQHPELSFFF